MMRQRLIGNNDGGVALEFALVAPLLFLVIFAVIELGRFYFIRGSIQYAADEAGRYASVHVTASNTAISNHATNNLIGIDPDDVTIDVHDELIGGRTYKYIGMSYTFSTGITNVAAIATLPINVETVVPVLP